MGLTVYGGGGKPEEEKTVTAGTSLIEVLPSRGKTMKKVNVNPTPTEEKTITAGTSATTVTPTSGKYIKKVTVNPTPSQSKTVTPSTSQQTVSPDAGKLLSQVIVNAMVSGALSDITVSSAGLITAQVGTSGYLASGTKMTKQLTKQAAKTVTPSKSVQTAVSSGRYTTGAIKVAAIPSKYIDLAGVMGYTKVAVDSFSIADNTRVVSINHSLGEVPKFALLVPATQVSPTADSWDRLITAFYREISYTLNSSSKTGYAKHESVLRSNASPNCLNGVTGFTGVSSTTVTLFNTTGRFMLTGVEYKLITMA